MSVHPIRVLIVDDQEIIHDGLEMLFELFEDIEVAGTATNRHDAVRLASELGPDVILMDLMLSGLPQGVAASRAIHESTPHIPIIALSAFFSAELLAEAHQAGIASYLVKGVTAAEIVAAIRDAYRGKSTFSSDVSTMLHNQDHTQNPGLPCRDFLDPSDRSIENSQLS